jgi:putative membrane protein insertion efficiency factor
MPEETRHNPVQAVILAAIRWYQRSWSPDHSWRKKYYPLGYCRFTPTCSEYAYESVAKYGTLKGVSLALWRIARCNPCSHGGYDPVT